MEDDAAHRNTPLLPRSASFGERGMLDPLHGPLHRATANLRSACDGDLLAVRSACLLGGVSTFAVGMMGVLNPFAVLSPLHLLTCLYLLPISLLGVAIELDVPALAPIQRWLTFWLRGLTLLSGKGALYIVTGTLAAGLGDPIGLAVGVLDMAAGAACDCRAAVEPPRYASRRRRHSRGKREWDSGACARDRAEPATHAVRTEHSLSAALRPRALAPQVSLPTARVVTARAAR